MRAADATTRAMALKQTLLGWVGLGVTGCIVAVAAATELGRLATAGEPTEPMGEVSWCAAMAQTSTRCVAVDYWADSPKKPQFVCA
jgi:hypothetical protein